MPPKRQPTKQMGRPSKRPVKKPTEVHAQTCPVSVETIRSEMNAIQKQMNQCVGVVDILKYKVLQKQYKQLELKLTQFCPKSESVHEKTQPQKSQGEIRGKHSEKKIELYSGLHPMKPSQKNILQVMNERELQKYQTQRAHQKRESMITIAPSDRQPSVRVNSIDTCVDCFVDLVVNREMAIAVCPKCGFTRRFASHILDSKEVERDDGGSRHQVVNHMQKFSSQFEHGHPSASIDVLEELAVAYSKIHVHDPSKVQACRTSLLLKNIRTVPKSVKKIPDRLTKELKAEGIPEFTSSQLQQLLEQRNRLKVQEDVPMDEIGKKTRKSFNNHIFMRQLGRSSQMEPARLFPNPKTTHIHVERTKALEQACQSLETTEPLSKKSRTDTNWALYPAS